MTILPSSGSKPDVLPLDYSRLAESQGNDPRFLGSEPSVLPMDELSLFGVDSGCRSHTDRFTCYRAEPLHYIHHIIILVPTTRLELV